jgi:hypothetical protein
MAYSNIYLVLLVRKHCECIFVWSSDYGVVSVEGSLWVREFGRDSEDVTVLVDCDFMDLFACFGDLLL